MAEHKFYYWYAERLDDKDSYSIIARTKRDAEKARQEAGEKNYRKPVQLVIHYIDLFDLCDQLTGEGGGRGFGQEVEKAVRKPKAERRPAWAKQFE